MEILFGKQKKYIFARVLKNKASTPYDGYEILDKADVKHGLFYPVLVENQSALIFFKNVIFNSYVISEEENVFIIKSYDAKTTVLHKSVGVKATGILITVKVVKEMDNLRVVKIYAYDDSSFVGFKTQGVFLKDKLYLDSSRGCNVRAQVQHRNNDKLNVVLGQLDEEPTYWEVDNLPEGAVDMKVLKCCQKFYVLCNKYIQGILYKEKCDREISVGDVIQAKIYDRNDYRILFHTGTDNTVKLQEGMVIEAKICCIKPDSLILDYSGFRGIYRKSDMNVKIKCLEDYYSSISTVSGIISSWDVKTSSFTLRSTDTKRRKAQDAEVTNLALDDGISGVKDPADLENKINLSVPFSTENVISSCECGLISYIARIALPLNISEQFTREFADHTCGLLGNLEYLQDRLLSDWRLLYKKYGNVLIDLIEPFNHDYICSLWEKYRTEPLYRVFYKKSIGNREVSSMLEKDELFQHVAVANQYLYNRENARDIVYGFVSSKEAWLTFINHESNAEFRRKLFLECAEKWDNVNDVKQFYKLWLDYELPDLKDDVKDRAKRYVEKIKSTATNK